MGTELKPLNEKTSLNRFWGGSRGICMQITQVGLEGSRLPAHIGFVQLTREDAKKLGEMLTLFANDPMNEQLEN